jgi:chromosome partitioning protein
MQVISLLNEKGGSGKSTLAINLATSLHRRGAKVVLLDCDPQGTVRDWRNASPDGSNLPPVLAADKPNILKESISTLSGNDYVIIDGPAKAEDMTRSIIRFTDVALIVIQPSAADIWAASAVVKLINDRKEVGGQLEAAFVLNRVSSTSKLSKEATQGDWNEYGIEQLASTVGNRVSFAQALGDGVSVFETSDGQARAEIDLVLQELEDAKWLA